MSTYDDLKSLLKSGTASREEITALAVVEIVGRLEALEVRLESLKNKQNQHTELLQSLRRWSLVNL